MRILQVVHDFVPGHVAGAELYCYYLSRALAARGHSVHVLFTECDWSRPQYSYRRFVLDNLTCHEVVHNHEYRSFEETYLDPRMEERFEWLLDAEKPDLVHLHHLWNHSLTYPRLAKRRGIPVIFTLHDYWLSCINHGQRLHPDHGVCVDIDTRRCADCVSRFPAVPAAAATLRRWWATSQRRRASRRTAPASGTPTDQARLERVKTLYRQLMKPLTPPRRRMAQAAQRLEAARAAARHVDLFVAPSAFLGRRMIEFGLPADRVMHSPNGMRTDLLHVQKQPRREQVRFGYVGGVAPHKGVHILIDAFIRAAGRTSRAMELRIHGSLAHFPTYVARLRALAGSAPVEFLGPFDNARADEVYAGIDALVIPSLWWENAPLTLFEARLAGKPVIASNGGSLADLVEAHDTVFRKGDVDDLARCLIAFADRRNPVGPAPAPTRPIKTIDQDARDMERRYATLVESASSHIRRAVGDALR